MFQKKKKGIFPWLLELLKQVLKDIILLYRNFLHWNLSKILIKISSFLLWIILSSPFLIIIVVFCFIDPINWWDIITSTVDRNNMSLELVRDIWTYPFFIIIETLLWILAFFAFFLWNSYSLPLESNLYLSYINSDRIKLFKNYYFKVDKIKKHILIMLRIVWFLFIPILIFLLSFIIFYIVVNLFWIQTTESSLLFKGLVFILWILFIACIFAFIYIGYRVNFSYMIFMDSKKYKKEETPKFYIKESFKLTKWIVFIRFLLIIIFILTILLPFSIFSSSLAKDEVEIKNYLVYKYWLVDVTKEKSVENYYKSLDLKYSEMSDEQLETLITYNWYLQYIFYIFSLLFLSGVVNMTLISFYRRELMK